MKDDPTGPRAVALDERRRWLQRLPGRKRLEGACAEHRMATLQDKFRKLAAAGPSPGALLDTPPKSIADSSAEPSKPAQQATSNLEQLSVAAPPLLAGNASPAAVDAAPNTDRGRKRIEGPGAARRLKSLKTRFRRLGPPRRWHISGEDLGAWFLAAAVGIALGIGSAHLLIYTEKFGSFDLAWRHLAAAPNCGSARSLGVAPALRDEAGYWPDHDADKDGIACEPIPRWKRATPYD